MTGVYLRICQHHKVLAGFSPPCFYRVLSFRQQQEDTRHVIWTLPHLSRISSFRKAYVEARDHLPFLSLFHLAIK